MKMYICKLCTSNQMLFQSKFCVIIVRKPITAFARIRPQQDSALYPDVGFTRRPFQPLLHYFFRSAAPGSDPFPVGGDTSSPYPTFHGASNLAPSALALPLYKILNTPLRILTGTSCFLQAIYTSHELLNKLMLYACARATLRSTANTVNTANILNIMQAYTGCS